MTELSPLESTMKEMKIDLFFEKYTGNSPWSKQIEEDLDYFKSAYKATVIDSHLQDCSLFFEHADGLCFVPLTLLNSKISFLHLPVHAHFYGRPPLNQHDIWTAIKSTAKIYGARSVLVSEEFMSKISLPEEPPKKLKMARIDLTLTEEEIYKGFSKGHRSSLKAGQKILDVKLFDSRNFSEDKFQELISLYVMVAQRNKGQDFWDAIRNAILEGSAFFTMAYFENRPASCQLFYNNKKKVIYALAAYDRELMSQGLSLSHWPLYCAILESKKAGFKIFELGYHFLDNEDQKLQSIFKFKANFAKEIEEISYWEIEL